MCTLELLITRLKEAQSELKKSIGVHDSVEGFMSGLKALPKGSPERGRFITQHMNHGPFLSALKQHPQGAQLHGQLTSFLNSRQNAGFRPGQAKTTVATQPAKEVDFKSQVASTPLSKPMLPTSHRNSIPSMEERMASHPSVMDIPGDKLELDTSKMAPQGAGTKISHNMTPTPQNVGAARLRAVGQGMIKGEEFSIAKNGQWSLSKVAPVRTSGEQDLIDNPGLPLG